MLTTPWDVDVQVEPWTPFKTRRIGAQETAAVQKLLENRVSGVPIQDSESVHVFEILLGREQVRPRLFANFGFYALRSLNDQSMGLAAFRTAANRVGPNDESVTSWHRQLRQEGYVELAHALSAEHTEVD
jgi:hypothetical protein